MSVTEVIRDNEIFKIKDEGLEGFVIERENVDYYNDFDGYPL